MEPWSKVSANALSVELHDASDRHLVSSRSLKQGATLRVTNTQVLFAAYDGNVVAMISTSESQAKVKARYDYNAFGETVLQKGDGTLVSNSYRFSTKYQDEETGLCYYGYRYYSPELGRLTSRDPIEEEGGFNLYGMVGNDVVNRWDYLGLDDRGVSLRYCDAAAKYPQKSWLKCACGVSRNIDRALAGLVGNMLITASTSPKYVGMRDRANWFRCVVEKWETALNKWEGHPMDKKQEAKLRPAWSEFCKDCQGDKVSEPECCKKQAEAEAE